MRQRLKLALYAAGDWLGVKAGTHSDQGVTRPWLFKAGNLVSELGWRFR